MGICNASRVEVNNVINSVNKSPSSNNNTYKLNGSTTIENMGTSINTPQKIIKANKIVKKYKKKKAEEDLIDGIFNNDNNENNKKYISIITKKSNINNDYIIHYDKILGHGLTSKVYLANKIIKNNNESSSEENNNSDNSDKNKNYAIKIINKKTYNNNNLLQNEILITLFLNHPNIVKTYEIFEDEENIYFVMEYIKGLTLGDFILKYKLNIKMIKKLLFQILYSISYLHNQIKICHRDLKSNNIMVYFDKNKNIKIKIIDFGFSCYINNNNKMNEILGTINYSAPELLKGLSYNHKIDIWSIGIILIDMLLGYNYYENKYNEYVKNNNNNDKDNINQNKFRYLKNLILNEIINFDEITNDEDLKNLLILFLNKNPKHRINAIDALDYIDKINFD